MRALLGLISALALPAAALAQGVPIKPPELSVAPSAAETTTAPSNPGAPDGSLDVCKELIAFLQEPQATQPAAGQPAPNAAQRKPPAPQPGGAQGTDAPLPGQTTPNVDKPQQQSGLTGPVPPGQRGSKPPIIPLETAQRLAARGDQRGCRDAAQQMRRAGVTMPDTLIVLAALPPDRLPTPPGAR